MSEIQDELLQGLYNKEVREQYLNMYENIITIKSVSRIFRLTANMEESLDKDLYMFTREELLEFFDSTSPKTKTSARSLGSMVTKYINWAVKTGKIKKHPFPVKQNFFNKYANNESDHFFKLEELRYFTHVYLQNAQDGVILELLFHGIQGRNVNEICNLTLDNIEVKNRGMTVYDSERDRVRKIQFEDDTVINYCLDANKEDIYYKRNKEMEDHPRIKPYTELMHSRYILKNSRTNTTYEEKTKKYTIYNRLKNMKKFEEMVEVKQKLTVKNIVKSGQIYMASRLYEQEGQIGKKQRTQIAERYSLKEHYTMADYLNEEVLFQLYPHLK